MLGQELTWYHQRRLERSAKHRSERAIIFHTFSNIILVRPIVCEGREECTEKPMNATPDKRMILGRAYLWLVLCLYISLPRWVHHLYSDSAMTAQSWNGIRNHAARVVSIYKIVDIKRLLLGKAVKVGYKLHTYCTDEYQPCKNGRYADGSFWRLNSKWTNISTS